MCRALILPRLYALRDLSLLGQKSLEDKITWTLLEEIEEKRKQKVRNKKIPMLCNQKKNLQQGWICLVQNPE